MKTQNNMRQLAIAAHNVHETYGQLPPDAIYDPKTGKPLLSWRVAYLPFIEEDALYKQFHLNEPWDSPHNVALLDQMPRKYVRSRTRPPEGTHATSRCSPARAPCSTRPGSAPAGRSGRLGPSFKDITDGPENTALIVEAATAVPWTKPADLVVAPDRPLPAPRRPPRRRVQWSPWPTAGPCSPATG